MPTVSSNLVKVAANITVISFVLLLVAVQAASSDLKVSQLNSLIKDGQGVYGSVTYIWRVADRNYTSAIIPQDFHETSRRIGDETRAELSRRGISDKSYIASAVSSNVEQEREIDKLLRHFANLALSWKSGLLSTEDVRPIRYYVVRVMKNREIEKYMQFMAGWSKTAGLGQHPYSVLVQLSDELSNLSP